MTYPVRIAYAFDALVIRLTDLAASRQDFFQEAVSAGLDIVDLDTSIRFCLGDIACLIEGRYGADRIGMFAAHVKKARSTLYGYATVSRYYPPACAFALVARGGAVMVTFPAGDAAGGFRGVA